MCLVLIQHAPFVHDCNVFIATGVLGKTHVRLHLHGIRKIHTGFELPLEQQA